MLNVTVLKAGSRLSLYVSKRSVCHRKNYCLKISALNTLCVKPCVTAILAVPVLNVTVLKAGSINSLYVSKRSMSHRKNYCLKISALNALCVKPCITAILAVPVLNVTVLEAGSINSLYVSKRSVCHRKNYGKKVSVLSASLVEPSVTAGLAVPVLNVTVLEAGSSLSLYVSDSRMLRLSKNLFTYGTDLGSIAGCSIAGGVAKRLTYGLITSVAEGSLSTGCSSKVVLNNYGFLTVEAYAAFATSCTHYPVTGSGINLVCGFVTTLCLTVSNVDTVGSTGSIYFLLYFPIVGAVKLGRKHILLMIVTVRASSLSVTVSLTGRSYVCFGVSYVIVTIGIDLGSLGLVSTADVTAEYCNTGSGTGSINNVLMEPNLAPLVLTGIGIDRSTKRNSNGRIGILSSPYTKTNYVYVTCNDIEGVYVLAGCGIAKRRIGLVSYIEPRICGCVSDIKNTILSSSEGVVYHVGGVAVSSSGLGKSIPNVGIVLGAVGLGRSILGIVAACGCNGYVNGICTSASHRDKLNGVGTSLKSYLVSTNLHTGTVKYDSKKRIGCEGVSTCLGNYEGVVLTIGSVLFTDYNRVLAHSKLLVVDYVITAGRTALFYVTSLIGPLDNPILLAGGADVELKSCTSLKANSKGSALKVVVVINVGTVYRGEGITIGCFPSAKTCRKSEGVLTLAASGEGYLVNPAVVISGGSLDLVSGLFLYGSNLGLNLEDDVTAILDSVGVVGTDVVCTGLGNGELAEVIVVLTSANTLGALGEYVISLRCNYKLAVLIKDTDLTAVAATVPPYLNGSGAVNNDLDSVLGTMTDNVAIGILEVLINSGCATPVKSETLCNGVTVGPGLILSGVNLGLCGVVDGVEAGILLNGAICLIALCKSGKSLNVKNVGSYAIVVGILCATYGAGTLYVVVSGSVDSSLSLGGLATNGTNLTVGKTGLSTSGSSTRYLLLGVTESCNCLSVGVATIVTSEGLLALFGTSGSLSLFNREGMLGTLGYEFGIYCATNATMTVCVVAVCCYVGGCGSALLSISTGCCVPVIGLVIGPFLTERVLVNRGLGLKLVDKALNCCAGCKSEYCRNKNNHCYKQLKVSLHNRDPPFEFLFQFMK